MEVRLSEERFLSTREIGRQTRVRIEEQLSGLSPDEELVINCEGVDAMTYSFADEVFGALVSDREAGRHLDHGLVVVGFNPDVEETLELVMQRRGLALFAGTADGEPSVLGAETWLVTTVQQAVALGTFRAADLSEALGITAQAVNNRLRTAMTAGALTRDRVVPEGGGKEYLYKAVRIPVHVY